MWKKLFLGSVLILGAQAAWAAVQVDGVAAYVNQHVITVSDVLGASAKLQQQLRDGQSSEAADALFLEVLDELIDRKLIIDSYEQQREIQIPPIMIDERVEEIVRELFRSDRNAFLRALGEEGRSEASWREDIRETVVVRAMRNLRVERHIHISPTDVRAYYNANTNVFHRPGEVTYRMLVVVADGSAEDGTIAAVQSALDAGESFSDVVQRYSIDPLIEQGGLRGPVAPDQLREEVRGALAQMEVGDVSGPTALGTHTIWLQLASLVSEQTLAFSEAYGEVEELLFRERATALYDSWLDYLRSAAYVSIAVESLL